MSLYPQPPATLFKSEAEAATEKRERHKERQSVVVVVERQSGKQKLWRGNDQSISISKVIIHREGEMWDKYDQ